MIYRGQVLDDRSNPGLHDLGNQTCVHVVCRKLDVGFLDSRIEEYSVREGAAKMEVSVCLWGLLLQAVVCSAVWQ